MKIETKKYFKFTIEKEVKIEEQDLIREMKEVQMLGTTGYEDFEEYAMEIFDCVSQDTQFDELPAKEQQNFITLLLNSYKNLLPTQFDSLGEYEDWE